MRIHSASLAVGCMPAEPALAQSPEKAHTQFRSRGNAFVHALMAR